MLSADVDAGFDPIYASASERNNASYLGRGVGISKYTGARGKSGASDANAEYVAEIRGIFEKANVPFTEFSDKVTAIGDEMALSIHVMHEDIFNSMHRI